MKTVLIKGKTFPVRAALQAMGASWDPVRHGWLVPANKEQEARRLVSGVGR